MPAMGTAEAELVLDPGQQRILELCRAGRNVFVSGIGGTGKSFLLRRIVHMLKEERQAQVAVTAPTGVAALVCGGQTLHSFAGCNVPSTVIDFDKCWGQSETWRRLDVLVIDEISMIQASFLDWLDCTVRTIRSDSRPFGGVQLIFAGDFCQLHGFVKETGASLSHEPPTAPLCMRSCRDAGKCLGRACRENKASRRIPVNIKELQGLAFQSVCWREADLVTAELTTCFRQEDAVMIRALSQIRRGNLDAATLAFVRECERPLPVDDGITATLLYSTNRDVDSENLSNLGELPGPLYSFDAQDTVAVDSDVPTDKQKQAATALHSDAFFARQCAVPSKVVLKRMAQVVCVGVCLAAIHVRAIIQAGRHAPGQTSRRPDPPPWIHTGYAAEESSARCQLACSAAARQRKPRGCGGVR